jgi:cysteine rich repeat protein
MTRSLLPLILCAVMAAQAALADDLLPSPPGTPPSSTPSAPPASAPPSSTPSPPAQMPSQQAVADARAACATDIQYFCAGVQPGGGRIIACLKQHKDQVSDGCKQAVIKATKGSN